MSCDPPYNYRPIEAPVVDNRAPVFPEHRSRLFAGGTYFRSLEQSPTWNNISLQVQDNINGDPTKYRLLVRYYRSTVGSPIILNIETYDVTQKLDKVDDDCPTSGIDVLRFAINGVSKYIEMYPRGNDTEFDNEGENDNCLSAFPETFMSGGTGGPVDASTISQIYTGPWRSVIIISTTEKQDGTSTNPPAERKVQQWNGEQWIPYQNLVPGACPATTLIGLPYVKEVIIEEEEIIIINTPPIFNQDILDQTNDESTTLSLSSGATDVDGDIISYNAVGLPTGLNIDTNTGLISGTVVVGASTNSPYNVTITANDGKGGIANDLFIWNIIVVVKPYYDTIIADGPVAYWRVDESSGTVAGDEIGNNDGTYQGTYILSQTGLIASDIISTSVAFDGTIGSKVNVPYSSTFALTTAVSLEVWIIINATTGSNQTIISNSLGGTDYPSFALTLLTSGQYAFHIYYQDGTTGRVLIKSPLATYFDGQVHHIVGTWDKNGDQKARLYIDSVEVVVSGAWNNTLWANINDLAFGGQNYSSSFSSETINGRIDEVAIYNYALTLSQIQDHYVKANGAPYYDTIIADGPLAYWRLGESTGLTAVDEMGNQHGTYTNDPVLGTTGLITNDSDTAVTFDGDNDYVGLGSIAGTDPLSLAGSAFSLEAWINFPLTGDAFQRILDKSNASSAGGGYAFYVHTSGQVGVTVDGTDFRTSDRVISSIINHHVVVTGDGSAYNIYVDGYDVGGILAGSYQAPPATTTNARIGTWNHATTREFNGVIDEVAIYTYALTLAEVQNHYEVGSGLTIPASYYDAIIADAPLAYWRLGESIGPTAVDEIGNQHGTYTNGPVLGTTGLISNDSDTAVTFDGGNDYIELGSIAGTDPLSLAGSAFSLEAWINVPKTGDNFQRILDKSNGVSATNGYAFYIDITGQVGLTVDGTDFRTGGNVLSANINHHFVVTGDGSVYRMFVDGVEVGGILAGSYQAPPATTTNARIGTWNHSTARELKGVIDEVAVYDYALTFNQIRRHYLASSV